MVKTILTSLTLVLAMVTFSANAQMSDRLSERPTFSMATSTKMVSNDAVVVTRDMTNRLHLNEAQFLDLLPLNRTKLASIKSINREYRSDDETRAAKLAELEAQFEQECSRILTPSQLSQFQQQNEQPAATPANSGPGVG
jgi:Spy/CpxP family protein refolding chaperone